ncbi:MAG: hypothetical protein Q9N34_05515 [Aquificota bacterium]|nr:hypothetical protein [Aquificota bacterium]
MIYEIIATGFYLGRLPAPGTVGTILGAGVAYLVSFNLWTVVVAGAVLFLLGLISTAEVIREERPGPGGCDHRRSRWLSGLFSAG